MSGENFATANSDSNWISKYEPGRRLRLETGLDSVWVDIDSIRGCWETLERLGCIRRSDVLEPGRRSAFMMALFQQVEGIRQERRGELYLVLRPKALAGQRRRQRLLVHRGAKSDRPGDAER